jgi:hypothetical protein
MTKPRLIALRSLLLTLGLTAGGLQTAAGDPPATEDGGAKPLLDEHCIKCHGSEVYTRPDRKVTTRDGLDRQVRRCETVLQLRWFEDDITEVARYLDRHYYHFK